MKVKVIGGKFQFNGKVYEIGDTINLNTLSEEKTNYLLKIVEKKPYFFEIIEKKKKNG